MPQREDSIRIQHMLDAGVVKSEAGRHALSYKSLVQFWCGKRGQG